MQNETAHHIKSIYLSKLFGRYTYAIPKEGEFLTDLNILYGENGLGKTTLLSLVFHLLSPSPNRAHKTAISGIPFQLLRVTLFDGTVISAEKDSQILSGPVIFVIQKAGNRTEWRFSPNARNAISSESLPEHIDFLTLPPEVQDEVRQALAQREYFKELAKLEVLAYMLTSDRILLGDSIDLDREPKRRPVELIPKKLSEIVTEQRTASVTQALNGATAWLQTKFIERGYGAGQSASNVYQQVVARIAKTPYRTNSGVKPLQQVKIRESLISRISKLNARSEEFAKLGLIGKIMVAPELAITVNGSSGNKLNLIESVLSPHLEELEARLDSIEPFYTLVNGFVLNINGFFRDKYVSYSVRNGVQILSTQTNSLNRIMPDQLSSGEQQLLLIFCHVLTARDNPSIFIIDEPEISLNILWQRRLVTSLQELSSGAQIQFIFASHSMEILSKHRNRVVTLEE